MNKKNKFLILTTILCLLSGCGDKNMKIPAQVTINEYEQKVYETFDVVKGDLKPVLELTLEAKDMENVSYFSRYDEMKINQVCVEVG